MSSRRNDYCDPSDMQLDVRLLLQNAGNCNMLSTFTLPWLELDMALFGIHTVLIVRVLFDLMRRRCGYKIGHCIRVICVLAYAVAAAHLAIVITYTQQCMVSSTQRVREAEALLHVGAYCATIPAESLIPALVEARTSAVWPVKIWLFRLLAVNIGLSDIVVILRACALWPRHRVVQIPSILVLCGTLITLLWCSTFDADYMLTSPGFPAIVLSWFTNLWSTGLVSWKTWRHLRLMKSAVNTRLSRTQVSKVLLIIVESGLAYAVVWTIVVALDLYDVTHTGPPTRYTSAHWALWSDLSEDLFAELEAPFAAYPMGLMMLGLIQIVSLYPTVVVVLVERTNSGYKRALDDTWQLPIVNAAQGPPVARDGLSFPASSVDTDSASSEARPCIADSTCASGGAGGTDVQATVSLVLGIRYIAAAPEAPMHTGVLHSAYCAEELAV